MQTLLSRLRNIMDMSQHSSHQETLKLIAHLDELERKLFSVGQLSFKSYKVSFLMFFRTDEGKAMTVLCSFAAA